ncbi:MAG: hypothetical protein GVY31_12640 [Alphaproteobacteria bacterium]|jgi:mono/diheme cytochrome c family protein|nr:hypothetical protein [Alphaproteobacteria bacterium]
MRSILLSLSLVLPVHATAEEALALDPSLVQAGAGHFADSCASCHGAEAGGSSAPDIRGAIPSEVARAARGMDQMPPVALDAGQAEAIGAWLMSLDPDVARIKLDFEAARAR